MTTTSQSNETNTTISSSSNRVNLPHEPANSTENKNRSNNVYDKLSNFVTNHVIVVLVSSCFMNIIGFIVFGCIVALVETEMVKYLLPAFTFTFHIISFIVGILVYNSAISNISDVLYLVFSGLLSLIYIAWLAFFKSYTPLVASICVRYFNCYASETSILIAGYCIIIFIFVLTLYCLLNSWVIFKRVKSVKDVNKNEQATSSATSEDNKTQPEATAPSDSNIKKIETTPAPTPATKIATTAGNETQQVVTTTAPTPATKIITNPTELIISIIDIAAAVKNENDAAAAAAAKNKKDAAAAIIKLLNDVAKDIIEKLKDAAAIDIQKLKDAAAKNEKDVDTAIQAIIKLLTDFATKDIIEKFKIAAAVKNENDVAAAVEDIIKILNNVAAEVKKIEKPPQTTTK